MIEEVVVVVVVLLALFVRSVKVVKAGAVLGSNDNMIISFHYVPNIHISYIHFTHFFF